MSKSKTPKLRFKGFSEDWEERQLGDIVDIGSGKDYKHLNYGNIPVYGTGGYMLSVDKALSYKEDAIGIGRKGTINKPYILKAPFWTVDTLFYAIPSENNNLNFIFSIFQKIDWKKEDESTGVPSLSKNVIYNINIFKPLYEEQQKIGDFFKNLDESIALHERKCEKLKIIKKAMLDKMFPKNGEKTPEFRFKGFSEDWEEQQLEKISVITMGQSPCGDTYSDSPSDYILVQGNADLKNGWVKPRIWTTQITHMAYAGDLIMSVRAPAGEIGKTAYNVVIGRGVAAIRGNEFIYQTLTKMNEDGYWKKLSEGSTFESLNSLNIKNAEIKIPTIKEQQKIGDFFKNLDNTITLNERKIEKLKIIKKAMLDKMFV